MPKSHHRDATELIDESRRTFHRVMDRLDALFQVELLPGLGRIRDREQLLAAWEAMPLERRQRSARRAVVRVAAVQAGAKILISIETYILVVLAYSGSRFVFFTPENGPSRILLGCSLALALAVSLVVALLLAIPQVRWFVRAEPADARRRRQVKSIARRQVWADLAGWGAGLALFILVTSRGSPAFVVTMVGAVGLAAITSSCLTYLFAEASVRPLLVLAMEGQSESSVMHGVRERMIIVWIVSSAVPMVGLIALNAGRYLNMLPPVAGPADWASVLLALVALVSGLRVVALVGRSVADPLTEMREVVEQAGQADFSGRVPVYDSSEIGVLQHGLNNMLEGLAERERIRDLFSRHVGDRVAELALSHDEGMFGANSDVAVLFVDITGSTSFAAHRDPRETAAVLNAFFAIVGDVVEEYDGLINKFEGDAALVIFGAPAHLDDPAGSALCASRELAARLRQQLPVEWGMGISYGTVYAGNIGARSRYEYTVIGDPVNESARLSDLAKESPSPVVASGSAVAAASSGAAEGWRLIDTATLRGRPQATAIYAPDELMQRVAPPSLSSVLSDLVKLHFRPEGGRRDTEGAAGG